MLTPVTIKTKCDVKDCRNDADFTCQLKGLRARLFVCTHCLKEMAKAAPTPNIQAPKSPKNAIKKKMEMKSEEE